MDTEQIEKRIAEILGWQDIHGGAEDGGMYLRGVPPGKRLVDMVPNYTRNLEAIFHAVQSLSSRPDFYWSMYNAHLNVILGRNFFDPDEHRFLFASAKDRAEALLKTLNQYES